ncbi:MAG: YicC family protein [Tissierellales bacterium]|nr:YicC family protein [Tissierellales bacterium]
MVRSMTGYGKYIYENSTLKIQCEIKSVNHRYLDINVKIPRYILKYEETIKRIAKQNIVRGKVDIYFSFDFLSDSLIKIVPDLNIAKSYLNAFNSIKETINIPGELYISDFIKLPDIISRQEQDIDDNILSNGINLVLKGALEDFNNMRINEGNQLKKDLLDKIGNIENIISSIESISYTLVDEYKLKLEQRISSILENIPVDEDRLAMEIVIFADRSGIDEEITRLKSHIIQFKQILENEDIIGRKLDFLIQEINRECNTIGSKSTNLTITNQVVELKTELEKIREQVQNIE